MSKHTPGPWHQFRQGTKRFVSQACDEDFRDSIAVVFEANYHPDGIAAAVKEADLNARLIASAPDLLAALETIENDCSAILDGDDMSGMSDAELFGAMLETVTAAIRKAKGE